MARKHHKPEEIVTKLRQVDVLVGQGNPRVDAIRQVSITEQTYYRLLSAFAQLRRAIADLTLDKLILTEAAKGNF